MIIDSHCHLSDPSFADLRTTLATARAHDVWGVLAVGSDLASNERTLRAAAAEPRAVWACLGFHPERPDLTGQDLDRVEEQIVAHQAHIVGIGEVGLPWYSLPHETDTAARMARARGHLDRLLALASRYDLAVALHAPHGAAVRALEALRRHDVERAVFHWHKAPPDVTRAIVDAGYLVSVTPEVVYRERDRDLVAEVPLEALLVETDGPWPYGGEFEGLGSGPWLAARVAEEIAKIKGVPADDVMFELSGNACRVFHLPWS